MYSAYYDREFIIVDEFERKKRLGIAALDQKFVAEAPVNIVVCANLNRISSYGKRGRELYCIQDSQDGILPFPTSGFHQFPG